LLAFACVVGFAAAPADATGLMVFTERNGGLYLMRDDGSGLTTLEPYCGNGACNAEYPAFSPDGSQITFETTLQSDGGGQDVIALIDTNGTDERFISLGVHGFANELGFISEKTLLFEGAGGLETIATSGGASTRLFQGPAPERRFGRPASTAPTNTSFSR
jgi:Tol biopolymer transport system component